MHMLVSPPFAWDTQRRNTLGATALDLALRNHHAYLPVVWPLAIATDKVFENTAGGSPTLTDIFLRPPLNPLNLSEVSLKVEH